MKKRYKETEEIIIRIPKNAKVVIVNTIYDTEKINEMMVNSKQYLKGDIEEARDWYLGMVKMLKYTMSEGAGNE